MNVALLGPEGAGLLARLHGECFAQGWSAEAMASLLAPEGVAALLALEEGEPAGFLLYRIAADEAEIITIGVLPGRRGLGLGAAFSPPACRRWRAAGPPCAFSKWRKETPRPARSMPPPASARSAAGPATTGTPPARPPMRWSCGAI